MAPTLSHAPRREVDNFYQNSFKQLSMIQQRQVGLLVGAAVADAAARPLNGYSPEEVEAYVQRVQKDTAAYYTMSTTGSAMPISTSLEDVVVFARVPLRGAEVLAPSSSTATPPPLLHHHSFSYLLFFEILRAINATRGDASLGEVQEHLVRVAAAVHPTHVFQQEHASLLHTLCCLLPTPAIYPYASDKALREYLNPFTEFLTQTSVNSSGSRDDSTATQSGEESISAVEAAAAERIAVRDYTYSALGVVLRNLQSNPDSIRNAAFMAVPGTAAIFPADVQVFVPSLRHPDTTGTLWKQREQLWDVQKQLATRQSTTSTSVADSSPRWLPLRCTVKDAAVVRESFDIARSPISFAKGVAQAIHLGGPTCQRAMLVGALLGAKLGVRHVPLQWLSATPDHQPVATMAMEVSQFVWNSPRY